MGSDWQESANKRRDARQSKPEDSAAKGTAKKNTRKWCGGKPGREHKPKCFINDSWYWTQNRPRNLACTTCGKVLETWYPREFVGEPDPKPEWVDK